MPKWYDRVIDFFVDFGWDLLTYTSALWLMLCGAAIGVQYDSSQRRLYIWNVTFVLAVVGSIVGFVQQARQKKRTSTLDKELTELRAINQRKTNAYKGLVRRKLSELHISLVEASLGTPDKNLRWTLYKIDGEAFLKLGRYCDNPFYETRGRPLYPLNEGVLARAWSDGSYCCAPLPDPARNPSGYTRQQREQYQVPDKTSSNFIMKSRLLGGIRVNDPVTNMPTAVVMIESTNHNGFAISEFNAFIDKARDAISSFLQTHSEIEPEWKLSAERDF